MDLYFSPLACSLATRIALDEAGAVANFIEVDPITHRTLEGGELREVSPLALVPALRTDAGEVLTENAAVLQYVASRFPKSKLAPEGEMARARLQQWLCFLGTELHKVVFAPLFDRAAPEGAKAYALAKAPARFDVLERHLKDRQTLLDGFTVADAYLVTILNWAQATPIDLSTWPAVSSYLTRHRTRPSVARSLAIELPLYLAEQERHPRSAAI
jgi:glutathione S-transferase